jgi:hypothetical protein
MIIVILEEIINRCKDRRYVITYELEERIKEAIKELNKNMLLLTEDEKRIINKIIK